MAGSDVRHNFKKGPPKDYCNQVWFNLVLQFQRRSLNVKVYDWLQVIPLNTNWYSLSKYTFLVYIYYTIVYFIVYSLRDNQNNMNVWSIQIILLYIWYSVIVQLIVCTRPDHKSFTYKCQYKVQSHLLNVFSFFLFFLFKNTLKFLSTFFPNYTKKIFITYINSKQFQTLQNTSFLIFYILKKTSTAIYIWLYIGKDCKKI